jgi:hypothetical protein
MRVRLTLIIYLFSIGLLIYVNPKMFYTKDEQLKTFGTGDSETKTLLPLWLVIILMAFFSYYLSTIFLILYNKD